MYSGIRIDTYGRQHHFRFRTGEVSFEQYVCEKGRGTFVLLESWVLGDKKYFMMGYNKGLNFNYFDLNLFTGRGDIIVYCVFNLMPHKFMDADFDEVVNYYKGEDLDDTIIQDETREGEESDEYDFNDDWLVRDSLYDTYIKSRKI